MAEENEGPGSAENDLRADFARGLLLAVMRLAGCAATKDATPFIDRNAPTGIDAGDGVAIVVSKFRECEWTDKEECSDSPISEGKQKGLENCLTGGIQAATPSFTIIPTDNIRGLALKAISRERPKGDLTTQLPSGIDADVRRQAEALRLRYLIILDVEATNQSYKGQFEVADPMIYFGRHHEKVTRMSAEVLDMREAHRSGKLLASSSGPAGWGVAFLYILPVPVYLSAMTETAACESLGAALTQFIVLRDWLGAGPAIPALPVPPPNVE